MEKLARPARTAWWRRGNNARRAGLVICSLEVKKSRHCRGLVGETCSDPSMKFKFVSTRGSTIYMYVRLYNISFKRAPPPHAQWADGQKKTMDAVESNGCDVEWGWRCTEGGVLVKLAGGRDGYALKRRRGMGEINFETGGESVKRKNEGERRLKREIPRRW